jgi:hypothetical protein
VGRFVVARMPVGAYNVKCKKKSLNRQKNFIFALEKNGKV